jgi:hypothetical protein
MMLYVSILIAKINLLKKYSAVLFGRSYDLLTKAFGDRDRE